MAGGGLVSICKSSGMSRAVREYMDDYGYFERADDSFQRGDLEDAANILRHGLYEACQSTGEDYDFCFNKLQLALGSLLSL